MARAKIGEQIEGQDFWTYEADEVDQVLATLPSKDKKISLYRIKPQGNSAYITEFFPNEFSLEWIKENYGGGKFSIIADSSAGPKKIRFELEGDPKIQGATKVVQKNVNGKHYLITMTEKELVERAVRDIEKGNDETSATQVSTGASASETLLIAHIQRLEQRFEFLQNANPGSSRLEFYKEMALMKEMFATPAQSASGIAATEIASLIKTGLELGAKAANGDVSGPSIWESLLEKAMPILAQAMTAVQNRGTIPMPGPVNHPMPNSELKPLSRNGIADILPGGMTEPKQEVSQGPAFLNSIRPYVRFLVGNAATGAAPDPWAEIILGQVPQEQIPDLVTWLNGPTWLQTLIDMDPRISLQQTWFMDLREAILETLKPEGNEDHGEEEIQQ